MGINVKSILMLSVALEILVSAGWSVQNNRHFTTGQLLREASGSKYHINSTDGPIIKVLCSPYCSCAVAVPLMGNSRVLMCVTANVSPGIS